MNHIVPYIFFVLIYSCVDTQQVNTIAPISMYRTDSGFNAKLVFSSSKAFGPEDTLFALRLKTVVKMFRIFDNQVEFPAVVNVSFLAKCEGKIAYDYLIKPSITTSLADTAFFITGYLFVTLLPQHAKLLSQTEKSSADILHVTKSEDFEKMTLFRNTIIRKNGNNRNLAFQLSYLFGPDWKIKNAKLGLLGPAGETKGDDILELGEMQGLKDRFTSVYLKLAGA